MSNGVFAPPDGSAPYGADYTDNTEFMLGDVWVTVVLLESNGAVDPNQENWTATQISEVKAGVQAGLDWWADSFTAVAGEGGPQYLAFHADWTYADSPVATAYEPVTHSYSWQYYWIHEFLDVVGYNTPDSYTTDLKRYNHDQRVSHNTHWAFTIFVVNSAVDADGKFSDGYYAYSYLGGPFLVMTYDNATWGIAGMGQVATHEMGHVFYALDEYAGSNSYTDRSGYYGVQNLNARDGNPDPASRVPSIMAEPGLQADAWANHMSSPSSLHMVGWRDSDGDGVFDVLDVPPSLSGDGSWNPVTSRFEFSGAAAVTPLDNLNTRGSKHDITINTIDRLQYRLDGGAWQDGNAYGLYSADVSQDIPLSQNGLHTIEFRAVSLNGTLASNVLSYDFEITGPQSQAPAMVDLAEESDTGFSASDNVTRLNNSTGKALHFIISGTTSGATVRLYAGAVEIGSQTAVGETTEIVTDAASVLADGVHQIVARQTEDGANQSSDSPALQLTVDIAAPSQPAAPDLTSASDTGVSGGDNITNSPPALAVAGAPCFRVYRNGVRVSGDYETAPTWGDNLPPDGTYSYAVTAVDLAGNESPQSEALPVTACTQPPQAGLSAEDVLVAGGPAYDFTVTFTHPVGVWAATLGDDNVRISGPGGFLQDALLVGVSPAGDGSPRTATYRILAPGGAWYDYHNGTYTVSLLGDEVADLAGNYAGAAELGTFGLAAPNVGPRITSLTGDPAVEEAALAAFTATAVDDDGDAFAYLWTFGDGSPAVSGASVNHAFADDGVYSVTLTVTDAEGAFDVRTVEVTVSNLPPVAVDDGETTSEDAELVIAAANLLVNDSDVPADALTVTAVTATPDTHGTVSLVNGEVRYRPAPNYNGPASFRYTVSDGDGGQAAATVHVTVLPVNNAPVANAVWLTVAEDAFLSGNVTGNDADSDPLTFELVDQPTHGTVVMQADGSFDYTPATDWFGFDSFTFRAFDGEVHSEPATVSLTVRPVNDTPTFVAGADLWVSRTAGPQTLVRWATSVQAGPANETGQAMTFAVTPAETSFFAVQPTISADGTLSYTPSPTAAGRVRLTVVLSDDGGTADGGEDSSAEQSFEIVIARPLALDQYGRGSFTDATGDKISVMLVGGGTGNVYFDSNADSDISRIVLSGTGDRSALTVSGRTSIGGIESDGPLSRIVASTGDLTGRVRIGAAAGHYAGVLMMFANVADADIESAAPISSLIVSQWLSTDGVRDRLSAPYATTVMSRGEFQADVTFHDVDRLGNSVGSFRALGPVTGSSLTLAGGANTISVASWTGGAIRAACVGSVIATREDFSPAVTLTGQRNGLSLNLLSVARGPITSSGIALAGGAGTIIAAGWTGEFQAAYVNSVIIRGDLSASLRLTDKGPSGMSMQVLQVTGTLDGAEVRTRHGMNTVIAASSRNSRVLAGVNDSVTGLRATTGDFLAPADPNRPIAINTFIVSSPAGIFENTVVSAPTLGAMILRGVHPAAASPFGLAAQTQITTLIVYGNGRIINRYLAYSLDADGQFNVRVTG